ncbi:rRNA methyltransferase 2, mitochondrial [Patella vulgata]|uniref:rRNA methyltransferase 2, mitochondrial n=1 Tax=Patella vulgata TaxID=6465 RepID=UPI00217F77B0|nr:rRNA methyltransferase 2, mitochondrial [Patella vulgata]
MAFSLTLRYNGFSGLLTSSICRFCPNNSSQNQCKFSFSENVLKTVPKNIKGKGKGSQEWLRRQLNDPYVKKAQSENYRCRSAYKLLEIDKRFNILKPGNIVIDCGAAPGSWCQVAVEKINKNSDLNSVNGTVIGVDLQHFVDIEGVHVIGGADFTDKDTQIKIMEILNGKKADVILSDMAPKASGIKSMDHELIIELCVKVLKFGIEVLKPAGTILCKIWMGYNQKQLEEAMKHLFESVQVVKPLSSRTDSAEIFLLAQNFKKRKLK